MILLEYDLEKFQFDYLRKMALKLKFGQHILQIIGKILVNMFMCMSIVTHSINHIILSCHSNQQP